MESILSERLQQKELELSARYDERLRNDHERYVIWLSRDVRLGRSYAGSQRGRLAKAVKDPAGPVDGSPLVERRHPGASRQRQSASRYVSPSLSPIGPAHLVARTDQDTVAKLVELDSIVDELQRANERVATVERRNELLRSEIERARSDSGETDRSVASRLARVSCVSAC